MAFQVGSPDEAERLQPAFIGAGGEGAATADQRVHEPGASRPVRDPFGTQLLVISRPARAQRPEGRVEIDA